MGDGNLICIVMFWFSQDASERGVVVFRPVNDSAQVRLGALHLDKIQIGENRGYGRSSEEKQI